MNLNQYMAKERRKALEPWIVIDHIRRVAHSINRPCCPRLNIRQYSEKQIPEIVRGSVHRSDGVLLHGHVIHRLGAWRS